MYFNYHRGTQSEFAPCIGAGLKENSLLRRENILSIVALLWRILLKVGNNIVFMILIATYIVP